jgi:hypothetical protein
MAGVLSTTAANSLLDLMFGANKAASFPNTYYLALFLDTPAPTITGGTEPSGNGYARVAVGNDGTNFAAASNRVKTTATNITFPTPTGAWGTVAYVGIYSASTGGTFYGYGALSGPIYVDTGVTVAILSGGFDITIPSV